MKKVNLILFAALIILIISLASCETPKQPIKPNTAQQAEESKTFCNMDDDCVCGGKDKDGSCYLGNKNYYATDAVDKNAYCPDFCGGIGSNLEVKCVENQCKQLVKDDKVKAPQDTKTECTKDSECEVGGCSATICAKGGKRIITTCEYRPEYACYKLTECACADNKCKWIEKQEFVRCLNEKSKENKDNEAVW